MKGPKVYRSRTRRGVRVVAVGLALAAALGALAAAGATGLAALSAWRRTNGPGTAPPVAVSPTPNVIEPGSLQPGSPDPVPRFPSVAPVPKPEPKPDPKPTAPAGPRTLRFGMEGEDVEALQRRLDGLGYIIASVDGVFGEETRHALVAFQKVNGLVRDGIAGPRTDAALEHPIRLRPRSNAPGFHVEIDLSRQVLFLVQDGRVTEIYDSSTGSGETYYVDGDARIAHTPVGTFAVERKIDGWRESVLGMLYRPAYFYGGYAIHGSTSVPPYPASHGCVRVTIQVMDRLFGRLDYGTPVIVSAG